MTPFDSHLDLYTLTGFVPILLPWMQLTATTTIIIIIIAHCNKSSPGSNTTKAVQITPLK
jgi:hypothetical protein